MAGEERDARLILQAEDRATKTFDQVAKAIRGIRKEIDEQAAAARKGEGSLDGLNASVDRLRDLGKQLVQDQGLLNAFERLGDRVGKAETRLDTAKAKLEAYQKTLGAQGATTDAQIAKQERLTNSVNKAQESYDNIQRQVALLTERMDRAGLAAGKFDQQTDAIVASAKEAAGGISIAKDAINDYAAAAERASNIKAIDARFAASPLGADDKMFARAFADPVAKLKDIELSREAEAAAVAFRKIGTEAAAAADDVSRFATQSVSNLDRFADIVRNIANPARETYSSLDGVREKIAEIEQVAAGKGTGGLNQYSRALGELAAAQRSLIGQAGLIDEFRQQTAAADAADAAFERQRAEVQRLSAAIAAADGPNEELVRETQAAKAAMEQAGKAAQTERTRLEELRLALKGAAIDSKNLDKAQEEIVSSSKRAAEAAETISGKQQGQGGFLGLNPYELQNLSFQINDVFTQLGSGTPVFQVIAQQGGQILQLFRGAIPFLLRWAPILLGIGSALAVVGGAIGRVRDEARQLREFTAIFATMGNDLQYSAQQFADAQIRMQDLGVSADDARKALLGFVKDGVRTDLLDDFIRTATGLTDLLGIDTTEAFKLLGEAATGGYEQIVALNEATNIYTNDQLEAIKTLIESGDAEAARTMAMEIAQQKTDEGIRQLEGPFARAWAGARTGWNNFLEAIGNTAPFQKARYELDQTGKMLQRAAAGWVYVTSLMKGANQEAALLAAQRVFDPAYKSPFSRAVKGDVAGIAGGFAPESRKAKEFIEDQKTELTLAKGVRRERELTKAAEEARLKIAELGGNNAQQELAAVNAVAILKQKYAKEDEREAKKAASASKAAQRKAEAEARRAKALQDRINNQAQQIENQLNSMEARIARGSTQDLQQRLDGVAASYEKIFASIDKFEREGGSAARAKQFREEAQANLVLLQQQEQMEFHEEKLRDLSAERKTNLDAIRDAYDRGDISAADAANQAAAANEKTAASIQVAANEALRFAEGLRTATPDPKLEKFIASLNRLIADNTGRGANKVLKDFMDPLIAEQGSRINDVVEQRNALIAAQNALVDLNMKTQAQADEAILAGLAATKPLLDEQVQRMKELLATLDLTNPAMRLLYDTWMAKLDALNVKQTYVNENFTQLKNGIDQLLTGGIIEGIESIAKAFATWATGGADVVDTLEAIGLAALRFIADTLAGIARLILQIIVLDTIQKVTGIPIGAMLRFFGGGDGVFGKVNHEGGIAGRSISGIARQMPAAMWAGAPRYHEGTPGAGLKKNEVAAVLKRGEEVLTEDDPRHIANGGGAGTPPGQRVGIRQILAVGDDEIAAAMAGAAGEDVVVTHIRRNRDTIRQELDIK